MKLIVTRKNHNRIEKDGTRKAYAPGEFFEGSEAELAAFSDRLDAYQEPEFDLEQEQEQEQVADKSAKAGKKK